LNFAYLLAALPVMCMPAAGSPLRFPDTQLLSFAPETVDPGSFAFRSWHPMREAWIRPEPQSGAEAGLPPPDFSVSTDLQAGTAFGTPPVMVLSTSAVLDPAPFPAESGRSSLLFLLIGISGCSVRLVLGSPHRRRPSAKYGHFPSQLPQIIHLTRPPGLP